MQGDTWIAILLKCSVCRIHLNSLYFEVVTIIITFVRRLKIKCVDSV